MIKKKIMFISSSGGHLSELLQLKVMFEKYDYKIVTELVDSTKYLKNKYPHKVNYLIFGTKKNMITYPFILLINCFLSLFYLLLYRPQYIITTGAHTAGPMCCIGKIFRKKIIYIESFANRNVKSVTGSLIYKFADLFIVQWKDMLKLYPKAKYFGSIY